MNLLEETLRVMEKDHKTHNNVAYVEYYSGVWGTWDDFAAQAGSTFYDATYGTQEILPSLRIVFKDGSWLERQEYDGAEWWEKRTPPHQEKLIDEDPVVIKADYWIWDEDIGKWAYEQEGWE